MTMRKLAASFIGLMVAFPLDVQSPRLSADQISAIDTVIQWELSQNRIPAMSVAIVLGDQVRYARGFGIADLEHAVPASARTVYRLGSLSKPITAVAVLQLMERGRVDLDGPVQKYCPAFPEQSWPVTARQLLAHLAGVRDYDNRNFLAEYFSTRHFTSITESLDIFKNDPLVHEPGTKYSYSTYGYSVLGCAVEGASAMSYEEFVREGVFTPAAMTSTSVDDVSRIIVNRARGYRVTQTGDVRNTGLSDSSNKIPGGGLVSTVEDVARFATALQSGALLNRATLAQAWTLQKTRDSQPIPYALGWRIADRNGMREVFHGGAAAGFSTFLYMLPDQRITVVLMANLESLGQKHRDDVARRLADLIIKG